MNADQPPAEPIAVVIHSLADARLALRVAIREGSAAPLLLSAPEAACFMGAAWWRALVAVVSRDHPGNILDVLDCGDAAGVAMQALRLGQRRLVLDLACPQFDAVLERATGLGGSVQTVRPPALDLAAHGALRRLSGWLAHTGSDSASMPPVPLRDSKPPSS